MIPYARQSISEEDIEAVSRVLRSELITQGPVVSEFEHAIADYCSAKHAIAVSNGTAALHLACLALGVGPGDVVWTSPNTFVASANCALYCGAKVDFVDIDPHSYNLSVKALEVKLIQAKKNNCLPKVIIPVHFAGQSCEMKAIKALSEQYGFTIIEDAAHALGGEYRGNKVGSCQYSNITIFSFHPAKMLTSGEGGMVLTNSSELADQVEQLRIHGVTRDTELMTEDSHGEWYYQQLNLGFNYRITDIQAALGLSQLKRLDKFVDKRRYLAKQYNKQLQSLPVVLPMQYSDTKSSWHIYVIQLESTYRLKNRKTVFEQLRDENIGVHVHYIPVHTQPFFQYQGFQWGDFPVSENYYKAALTLPLFVDLTEQELNTIMSALKKVLLN